MIYQYSTTYSIHVMDACLSQRWNKKPLLRAEGKEEKKGGKRRFQKMDQTYSKRCDGYTKSDSNLPSDCSRQSRKTLLIINCRFQLVSLLCVFIKAYRRCSIYLSLIRITLEIHTLMFHKKEQIRKINCQDMIRTYNFNLTVLGLNVLT